MYKSSYQECVCHMWGAQSTRFLTMHLVVSPGLRRVPLHAGAASTPSLFGAQPASSASLFGAASTPSLFGAASSASLFGAASSGSLFGAASTPSLFGAASAGALTTFGAAPAPTLFGGQPVAAQQLTALATKDGRPITHGSKWDDLSPQTQQYLTELE